MWNIKKITILLCFLSLVAFISCSAEDKTGSPKPEGETEITGETGGGGSGESGSGSGSGTGESGGSGETGGGSGTGGGSSGETKITIPEKYHGNYTRRGWSSFDDDAEIYADKIVLKLGKKIWREETDFSGTYKVADATVKKNTEIVDRDIIKNGESATVYLFKDLKNNQDLYFIFYDNKHRMGDVAFYYPYLGSDIQYFRK